MVRPVLVVAALVALSVTGCGEKMENVDAAPTPSANAVPAQRVQKNLPGAMGREGAPAAPDNSTMQQPMSKPSGL
ncbi:MAG: hypothetical protein SFX74_01015 [Fimbriimonadaceae bacterium]|nr:hypothetical protein [Fimbriimonadaceae bacterium]